MSGVAEHANATRARDVHEAPFLVWPVARREYYRMIWMSLLPALLWGGVVFGFRALEAVVTAIAAATLTHTLLKRGLRGRRAQALVYSHTLVAAVVLVALAHPTWPVWIVTSAALLLPVILMLVKGPGREPVHTAVVLALLLQVLVWQVLPRSHTYAGGADAILARDRLLMGDIRSQRAMSRYEWPSSRELGGDDAVRFEPPAARPAAVAAGTFDRLSEELTARPLSGSPDAVLDASGELSPMCVKALRGPLDEALALRLPAIDLLLMGIVPGRIGTVCLVAITGAGLFLAYRFILRPQSVVIFALAYLGASVLLVFTPACVAHVGVGGLWQVWTKFPAELLTLLEFLMFNSDAPFAGVFILALPGTEPLTPGGRRVFLVAAAVLAAYGHRAYPTFPAASVALTALMPLAGVFDRLFARRSWLNG